MKKTIIIALAFLVFASFFVATPAKAQSNDVSFYQAIVGLIKSQVENLKAQANLSLQGSGDAQLTSLKELSKVAEDLKKQVEGLQQTSNLSTTSQVLQISDVSRALRLGVSGEDVSALQRALAQHPSIYPEALVTGFFGPLTEKAVKNFQSQNSLPVTGIVDATTLTFVEDYTPVSQGVAGVVGVEGSEPGEESSYVVAGFFPSFPSLSGPTQHAEEEGPMQTMNVPLHWVHQKKSGAMRTAYLPPLDSPGLPNNPALHWKHAKEKGPLHTQPVPSNWAHDKQTSAYLPRLF